MTTSFDIVAGTGIVPFPGPTTDPFTGVTLLGAQPADPVTIDITEGGTNAPSDATGQLSGPNLTESSPGVYSLSDTGASIEADLQRVVFTSAVSDPSAPVDTGFTLTAIDNATGATSTVGHQIQQAIGSTPTPTPTPAPTPTPTQFSVVNLSNATTEMLNGTGYVGPVAGLQTELDLDGATPYSVTSYTPNVFILTGSGEDYINVASGNGNNVIDGGTNSNFLVGGSGDDSFYLDARNPTANIWDTVQNLHSGDGVTVWGVTPSDFTVQWLDNQGAPGATGLTGVFSEVGNAKAPAIGLTMAGFTSAALSNGALSISYGTTQDLPGLPGSNYMHIQVN